MINIDYSQIKNEELRRATALSDLEEFIGTARYQRIMQDAMIGSDDQRNLFTGIFHILCGVSGYPVEVFLDEFLGRE